MQIGEVANKLSPSAANNPNLSNWYPDSSGNAGRQDADHSCTVVLQGMGRETDISHDQRDL